MFLANKAETGAQTQRMKATKPLAEDDPSDQSKLEINMRSEDYCPEEEKELTPINFD
jgi:hypothetical protein